MLGWRQWSQATHQFERRFPRWNSRLGVYLLHGLMGVVVLPGCAWVRAQAQQRSVQCEELCAQAGQAQEAGQVDQADRLLDKALKKSPRDLEVQRQLADSLWQVGRQKESLEQLTLIAEAHPQDLRLSLRLAERYLELEEYQQASRWVEAALSVESSSLAALRLKAAIELSRGDDSSALATYQRIAQQDDGQAAAQLAMGEIHLRRGQPERAAPLLRSALIHPRSSESERTSALWQLGIAYAQVERWSDAADTLHEVSTRRVMTPDDWHAVAYAAYKAGQHDQAQADLDHALFLDPRHAGAQELASVLNQPSIRLAAAEQALLPPSFERTHSRKRATAVLNSSGLFQ